MGMRLMVFADCLVFTFFLCLLFFSVVVRPPGVWGSWQNSLPRLSNVSILDMEQPHGLWANWQTSTSLSPWIHCTTKGKHKKHIFVGNRCLTQRHCFYTYEHIYLCIHTYMNIYIYIFIAFLWNVYMYMAGSRLLSSQEKRKERPPNNLHTNFAATWYVHFWVCVMCIFEAVLCAVLSLCYVQVLVCLLCSA